MQINRNIYPINLQIEHYPSSKLGINTRTPRLSWQYKGQPDNESKIIIEIMHHLPGEKGITEIVSVNTKDNSYLDWPIEPLRDRELVAIRIKIVHDHDESDWSEILNFDIGILEPFTFMGRFIGYPEIISETDHRPQPLIRTEFYLQKEIVYARLYCTALGLVESEINGKRVNSDILNPGWTDYENRLKCQSYDVLDFLNEGNNALGFWLGDGWFRGRTGPVGGQVNYYGDRIGVYAQLEVVYIDGSQEVIYTNAFDNKWKAKMGPIVQSNIYEGEWYDQRLEINGWSKPNFDDKDWAPPAEIPFDLQKIIFSEDSPINPAEIHEAVDIIPHGNKWIVDFGQNCTQRVRFKIHGLHPGNKLTIRHAEVLNLDGSLAMRPLRRGIQTDSFISDGSETTWEAKFTIHGFRYIEVEGWQGTLNKTDLVAQVYHSEMNRSGSFICSNPMINQLHENTLWSMNSNFVSIPTDCPQRDERLGWTGDIALFAPTAGDLYDTSAFLSNWLSDVIYERNKFGTLPVYTPYMPFVGWTIIDALAIWGDVAVMVPWSIYLNSGDKSLLKQHSVLSKAWIDEVIGYLSDDGIWDRKPAYPVGQLGDWLDPTAPPDNPVKAMTQKELVATAFFINSCSLLVKIMQELDNQDEAENYIKIVTHSKRGFINRFFKATGIMTSDTQCAYSLAIALGILDEDSDLKNMAGQRLAKIVSDANYTIATGFAGTPYILEALVQTNHIDIAYKLLLSEDCPSWLYQIKMGATTTWERWDSLLPDGNVNPGEMTSFNHYALGSVTHWFYGTIGGLSAITPGWRLFKIAPRPGKNLTHAEVEHVTPNGVASVKWRIEDKMLKLEIVVPFNTKAILQPLFGAEKELPSGKYNLSYPLEQFIN